MSKRKNIITALVIFIALAALISTTGCSKPRQGVYLELLTGYTNIKSGMMGHLAREANEPKKLLFLIYHGRNFTNSEYKKGITIVADIAKFMDGQLLQQYASCNVSEGSKVVYYEKVRIWYILKADIVEAEKQEEK